MISHRWNNWQKILFTKQLFTYRSDLPGFKMTHNMTFPVYLYGILLSSTVKLGWKLIVSTLLSGIRHISIHEIEHSWIRCSVKWSVRSDCQKIQEIVQLCYENKLISMQMYIFEGEWCIILIISYFTPFQRFWGAMYIESGRFTSCKWFAIWLKLIRFLSYCEPFGLTLFFTAHRTP